MSIISILTLMSI